MTIILRSEDDYDDDGQVIEHRLEGNELLRSDLVKQFLRFLNANEYVFTKKSIKRDMEDFEGFFQKD